MNINLNISSGLSEHYDFIYMIIQTAVNKQAFQFANQPLLHKIEQDITTCLSIIDIDTSVRVSFDASPNRQPVLSINIGINEFIRVTAQIAKDFRSPF